MSTHAERLEAAKAGRPAAEFRPPDLETDPAPSLTEHAHEVMRHLDAATVWHVELLATLSEACLRRKKALDKEVEIARKKAEQERRKQRREQHNYEMTSAADEDYYLDGSAVGAVLSMPWGVASEVGAGGAVYLVDSRNHCVHKYVGLGGAGAPGAPDGGEADEDAATLAKLRADVHREQGIDLDQAATLSEVEAERAERREAELAALLPGAPPVARPPGAVPGGGQRPHTLQDGVLSTIAGARGRCDFMDAANGAAARFAFPAGCALDPQGRGVLVADQGNHRVRLVAPNGATSTFAGTGAEGAADGPRVGAATFHAPWGVCAAPDGTVYVSEWRGHRVRAISAAGLVTTLAGA